MKPVRIVTYSHGFIVYTTRPRAIEALVAYCYKLAEFKFYKPHPKAKPYRAIHRVYAGARKNRTEFRFHINCLEDVLADLGAFGFGKSLIDFEHKEPPTPAAFNVDLRDHISTRKEQKPAVEYLSNPDQPNKVCDLQTGKGKTFVSLVSMFELGFRTLIQLRGGFIHRWVEEIENVFDLKKDDLMIIRGRDSLQTLINLARNGELKASIIIVTWKTLYNLFKAYELDGIDNEYGISPEQLYELCNIGTRVNDEIHLDYHFNFRSDIYSNVKTTIQLSATLKTKDRFRKRIYDIAIPDRDWFKDHVYDRYIGTYSVRYKLENPYRIRTHSRGDDRYSHQAFEKSILRDKKLKRNYADLIGHTLDQFFFADYQSGQKAIVFCSMVKFCNTMVSLLKKKYPKFDIRVYYADTPDHELDEADIIVTTIESCGVAVDIKDLKTAILTRALDKKEMNEQVMGRLRKLKNWPDVTPIFAFFTCVDVPKHLNYERNKEVDLQGKYLYFRHYYPPVHV